MGLYCHARICKGVFHQPHARGIRLTIADLINMTMAKTFREAESSCKCTNPDCVQKLAVSAPGTNPGTFYVSMKITHPDLSEQLFNEWYDKTHIPDAFKTRAFKEAYRWKALDSAAERPFLNTYPLEDVDFLNSKEFKSTAWSSMLCMQLYFLIADFVQQPYPCRMTGSQDQDLFSTPWAST